MIISPSVAQILKGVIHEMNTSLKTGLEDPVKRAQIDTMVGVLSSCAVRTEHETVWMMKEVGAIRAVADEFVKAGHGGKALKSSLSSFDETASPAEQYDSASHILSLMADVGSDAGAELSAEVFALMELRLEHETYIIGGGFEAAGRS